MSDEIRNYIEDLNNQGKKHTNHWAIPLSDCYEAAFTNFKETLQSDKEQREAQNKLVADLLLLGLTLPVGGAMTVRLGSASLKKLAGDAAVKQLSLQNWGVATSAVAASYKDATRYVVGELADQSQNLVSKKTRDVLAGLLDGDPMGNTSQLFASPKSFQNRLTRFCLSHEIAAHDFAAEIRDNDEIAPEKKAEIAAKLRQQPYFKDAPKEGLITDKVGVAKDIELLMWAAYILHTDRWEQATIVAMPREGSMGIRKRDMGEVTELPSAENYGMNGPKGNLSNRWEPGDQVPDAYPVYDKPGSTIMKRIETLWSERISKTTKFANGAYDVGELKNAERISKHLVTSRRMAMV